MRPIKLTTIAATILGSAIAFSPLPVQATEGGIELKGLVLDDVARQGPEMIEASGREHWLKVIEFVGAVPIATFSRMDESFAGFCQKPVTKDQVIVAVADQVSAFNKKLSDDRVEWKSARALSESFKVIIYQAAVKNCLTILR